LRARRRLTARLLTVVISSNPTMTSSDTPALTSGTGTGPTWSMP
jgi:hypothetical protein